jgi:hypothetical protein
MRSITIHRLSLHFDADQITHGGAEEQVRQAVDLINASLHGDLFGLSAQLIATPDEIEVELSDYDACERFERNETAQAMAQFDAAI